MWRWSPEVGEFVKMKHSQEEIELNPLKKHVFEVFAFLASLRHLVNISGAGYMERREITNTRCGS